MSQHELARRVRTSVPTVSRILSGESGSSKYAVPIAEALGAPDPAMWEMEAASSPELRMFEELKSVDPAMYEDIRSKVERYLDARRALQGPAPLAQLGPAGDLEDLDDEDDED
jgi:transcriptional regulator with XRE-family HTH domain